MQKYILSITVKNNSGVLARVSSLFGRRMFNIHSLTASATTNPNISRMSIIVEGDESILEQVIKQVSKLEETISVEQFFEQKSYCKELLFIKINAFDEIQKNNISEISKDYNAVLVCESDNKIIVELTETPSRIDKFLSVISDFDIIDICRSGVTAIAK